MACSDDLRVRVIDVVEGRAAARAAARQFAIGDLTATIRWAKRWRETGSVEAKSNKGKAGRRLNDTNSDCSIWCDRSLS